MDELSRQLINRFQGGLPIVENPYSSMASVLHSDETGLISSIKNLLENGSLSRFGPLYNSSCMGGGLTLAALSVSEENFDPVAELVNSLPEIAHNYRREHDLNMWFVIATETPQEVKQAIDKIERLTGLTVYNFPKIQEFYLGLWLSLDEDGGVTTRSIDIPTHYKNTVIDELDRKIIQATQKGLPLVSSPFVEVAALCGCDSQTAIDRLKRMLDHGVIRRIGAVPNHYKLGLRSNGMSVWDIPGDRLNILGKKIGKLDFVSHCYERPRSLPLWPYNLFAMVHGHNRDEVNRKVAHIADLLGRDCDQHEVLFSTRILKKSGLRLVA
jgi:DNA-binding Lrp family transcriptional regulator